MLDITKEDYLLATAIETAWYTYHVWTKPQKHKTPNDFKFMADVIRD